MDRPVAKAEAAPPGSLAHSPARPLRTWTAFTLVLALTLLAYFPALENGPIWNDQNYIKPALRSWTGLAQIRTEELASSVVPKRP